MVYDFPGVKASSVAVAVTFVESAFHSPYNSMPTTAGMLSSFSKSSTMLLPVP